MTDNFIGNSFDLKFFLMKITRDIDANIEPHTFTVEEFTKDNPLVS
ncbi:MAG: hypothetical protein ACOX6A_03035 [Atribacter sp.]|nr:hypothetical protein [Atribacterota bacterium]